MRKILLEKKRSKESVNNVNIIPVEFNRDISTFRDEILVDTLSMMDVYNKEKDASSKHRLIFTIYPICTNVLFNKISEIIYKEGSDKATLLTWNENNGAVKSALQSKTPPPINLKDDITSLNAIRNTEYSNSHFDLTYHCGVDIFNNHLLRNKENVSVQKQSFQKSNTNNCKIHYKDKGFTTELYNSFNTIGDLARDFDGNLITTYLPSPKEDNTYAIENKKALPLYLYNTIKSFKESYNDNITRKNGWIGFTNPSTLHIPIKNKDHDYYINKCLNNLESCAFVDLAPERDLFSFTPKRNEYRNRLEYNWDYFITYPAESDYGNVGDSNILIGKGFGLPLTKDYTTYIAANNTSVTTFCCPVKHNLKTGDFVKILFKRNECNVVCEVISTSTVKNYDVNHCFAVRTSDIEDYIDDEPYRFFKNVNGYDCEYYYRKFKKLGKYNNSINQLAFAKTIYDDEISQIVFTDDIDIKNIKDNRKRPITELYLTVLKSNRGHKEHYEKNIYNSNIIEYSHVFGPVTSGFDLPEYCSKELPVIRYQHNITDKTLDVDVPKSSSKLEEDITKDLDMFYGDLVEFNVITSDETVLEDVLHRFNTMQRECSNYIFSTLHYDEIYSDMYDYENSNENSPSATTHIIEHRLNEGFANIAPEGYIYKPHHRIKVGEFSETIKSLSDIEIKFENIERHVAQLIFSTKENYVLEIGDYICLVDKTFRKYFFKISEVGFDDEKQLHLYVCVQAEEVPSEIKIEECHLLKHNPNIPQYANMLHDNTWTFLWKDIALPSTYNTTSELYKIPFTNNAFYHHENVIFTVKRQDPTHQYGMYLSKNGEEIEDIFEIPSTEFDITIDKYIPEEIATVCF